MATKLRIAGQTGVEIYAVIRNEDNEVWDGTAFETFDIANKDNYDVPLTEQGSTAYYSVDFPSDITTAGNYHITYHQRLVSGQVDLSTPDDVVHQEIKIWDGTSIVESLVNQASVTDICNMALGHLGVSTEIENFETDTSDEAIICRRFFETARDKTLREYRWSFATQYITLGFVKANPTSEWAFSYRYPSDCLMIRRILSGSRNDSPQSRVPRELARDATGLLIYTDMEDAELEYTIRDTNPSFYPPDFTLALSLLLAYYIAPKLTRGDPFKLGDRALKTYAFEMERAWSNTRNENQPDIEPDAQSIRARI